MTDQFKYLMRAIHGDSEEYDHMLKAPPGKALRELPPEPEPGRPLSIWQRIVRWWRNWKPEMF